MTTDAPSPPPSPADDFKMRVQAETTLLIWVRTSLSLMGFGFVVARFGLFLRELAQAGHVRLRRNEGLAIMSSVVGTVLIFLGVGVLLCAVLAHRVFLRRLEQGEIPLPTRWSLAVILCLILAALGLSMAGYLALAEI